MTIKHRSHTKFCIYELAAAVSVHTSSVLAQVPHAMMILQPNLPMAATETFAACFAWAMRLVLETDSTPQTVLLTHSAKCVQALC